MSRRSSTLELSIHGDELEHDRIQLEHNLQHTDLSLHLSSTPDDDYSDVEYPRHNSAPSPISGFLSFEQRSSDGYDPIEHSQYNAWSMRSFNDDNVVNPYGGETISTAAHHASALTLSAGLGGRTNRRADVSLSGAEYDPERPLHGIMANMNSRSDSSQVDTIKSKGPISVSAHFDPLVVEDTAEVDRILQSGHATPPASSLQSSSSSSASGPGSPRPQSPAVRPKLSDALSSAAFSPKRPRSAQAQLPRIPGRSSSAAHLQEPFRQLSPPVIAERHFAPSREQRPTQSPRYDHYQQSLSYAQVDPKVKVHPATPSSANGSKFTKLARGLAQEIEAEQGRRNGARHVRGLSGTPIAQSTVRSPRVALDAKERSPFKDVANQVPAPTPRSVKPRTPFKSRVHLPDVTGLTSAILSPARARLDYQKYDRQEDGELEAKLFATLNAVQSKLAFLESENTVSRRRVHELELELEACKQEVARERTKVEQREELVARHAAVVLEREKEKLVDIGRQMQSRAAEMQRRDAQVEAGQQNINENKYKEAVEEKKALEALISTLRNHLARLTSELTDHQRLLGELRSLRDSDARALAEKSKDIDTLRQEVERLAGEVEVLRGVIEEGLRERRYAREVSTHDGIKAAGDGHTEDVTTSDEEEVEVPDHSFHPAQTLDPSDFSESEDEDESTVSAPAGRHSPVLPPMQSTGAGDKTLRTDHATVGSSLQVDDISTRPFVDVDEVGRISTDLQDRRSERSTSLAMQRSRSLNQSLSDSQVLSRSVSRSVSPTASLHSSKTSSVGSTSRQSSPADGEGEPPEPTSQEHPARELSPSRVREPAVTRSSVPTPVHALRQPGMKQREPSSSTQPDGPPETPFPKIHGERLERLFFSAPEHNAQTCTVCHRRLKRQDSRGVVDDRRPFWSVGPGTGCERQENDDEGFAEGSDDDLHPSLTQEGKGKEHQTDKLPPQTVLSRVIRELEDDFTHFKSIYVELADQYKLMDAASNVAKRNVVAGHLREVIDILEQKGDQIASLYDLLTFKDKPTSQSNVPARKTRAVQVNTASWGRARGLRTRPVII
ncbi:hypothetical protein DAEQUDRAFT_718247 [Daedalea quercina L-15889]|uniref:Cep57 centrosome microtubule-binding domain-containing protein n=1 Tax=Daedalea quercina L-15889 TaxID=1314783 RepID=A0A165LDC6_9APHY|nr:hypothetical protein DAEQUDRAFT_718247 [Daedalea quercina L-15889]